jgi:hypothetical protein
MDHKRLLEEIENIFNTFSVSSQMFTLCQANVVNMFGQTDFYIFCSLRCISYTKKNTEQNF